MHLHSTKNTTFREAHSLISKVKLAVILYQLYEFLLDLRIVGNIKDVHLHSTENTMFREAHFYSAANGSFVSIIIRVCT